MIFLRSAAVPAIILVALSACPGASYGQELLSRGEAALTLGDMDARMSRFPETDRAQFARTPENLARLMDQLLVNRALANEARELGLDKNPLVQQDLALAVEEVLAIHRVNWLLRPEALPDMEPLARERYLAQPELWNVPEARVVDHILISTEKRRDEDALSLARKVREEAAIQGAVFSELVATYSEDPGKSQNQGRYTITKPEEYQPEFAAAAAELKNPGDISEPVRTKFGYHIMRLDSVTPVREVSFDDARDSIVRILQDEYRKTARTDHVVKLRRQGEENANEELLVSLPARYGGRPEDVVRTPSSSLKQ